MWIAFLHLYDDTMTKLLTFSLCCCLTMSVGLAQAPNKNKSTRTTASMQSKQAKTGIYQFSALANNGQEVSFDSYRGKVLLIVNTASKCGLTPQYAALEQLYKQYADRGLVVIGFPCDQFGNQEPGSDEEIKEFCQLNYGVSFPIMKKIEVNGDNAHPIYKYLKSTAKGWFGSAIKWNFTKFLISRDGKKIERYAPITKPESLQGDIEAMLQE